MIGGLLVLLNVNHAVDDTNGPVVAGNYNKTASILISVRALDALVVLAPTLDPVVLGVLKSPVTFGDVRVSNGVRLEAFADPVIFGNLSVSHTLTLTDTLSPVTFGLLEVRLGIDDQPILSPTVFGLFGVDAELTLDHQNLPVILGLEEVGLILELSPDIPAPIDFAYLDIGLELILTHIDSPIMITEEMVVLTEHNIMIFQRLPIPIIAGEGGILSVSRTFIIDEPVPMVASPARFGKSFIYQEFNPACCTTV